MNPDVLRAAGAFMAIVGVAVVGATLGLGLSTVHISGVLGCQVDPTKAALCRTLVNPIQMGALAAFGGGSVAAVAGTYVYAAAGGDGDE